MSYEDLENEIEELEYENLRMEELIKDLMESGQRRKAQMDTKTDVKDYNWPGLHAIFRDNSRESTITVEPDYVGELEDFLDYCETWYTLRQQWLAENS